jgi:hypothetical protein
MALSKRGSISCKGLNFCCYQVDYGAEKICVALSSEIKRPKWETDQSPHSTAETKDVHRFTLTKLHIFTTCRLLTAKTLLTVKLLHLIYGMRRCYNGDCNCYVPLDVTLYYLTEIHQFLEGTYPLNLYVPWIRPKISITPRNFTSHSTDIYRCYVF